MQAKKKKKYNILYHRKTIFKKKNETKWTTRESGEEIRLFGREINEYMQGVESEEVKRRGREKWKRGNGSAKEVRNRSGKR